VRDVDPPRGRAGGPVIAMRYASLALVLAACPLRRRPLRGRRGWRGRRRRGRRGARPPHGRGAGERQRPRVHPERRRRLRQRADPVAYLALKRRRPSTEPPRIPTRKGSAPKTRKRSQKDCGGPSYGMVWRTTEVSTVRVSDECPVWSRSVISTTTRF